MTSFQKWAIPTLALLLSLVALKVSLKTTHQVQKWIRNVNNHTAPELTHAIETAAEFPQVASATEFPQVQDDQGRIINSVEEYMRFLDSKAKPGSEKIWTKKPPAPQTPTRTTDASCAILFVGLGRSFKSLVLPSIIKHVIPYNPNCDYFVHSYNISITQRGRSGETGKLDPAELYLLREALNNHAQTKVEFQMETEQDFTNLRGDLVKTVLNEQDAHGARVYFPWAHQDFTNSTVTEIIQQWHSIQSAWQLMEQSENATGQKHTTVGVLRSDVVFVTPIPVQGSTQGVTIPGFARYPVNDGLAYGERDAIQIYASERFTRLKEHMEFVNWKHPGTGIHPQSYLSWTIFPAMLDAIQPQEIYEHPSVCFLRAKIPEAVEVADCTQGKPRNVVISAPMQATYGNVDMKALVEQAIGRKCPGMRTNGQQRDLWCPLECNERCRWMSPHKKTTNAVLTKTKAGTKVVKRG